MEQKQIKKILIKNNKLTPFAGILILIILIPVILFINNKISGRNAYNNFVEKKDALYDIALMGSSIGTTTNEYLNSEYPLCDEFVSYEKILSITQNTIEIPLSELEYNLGIIEKCSIVFIDRINYVTDAFSDAVSDSFGAAYLIPENDGRKIAIEMAELFREFHKLTKTYLDYTKDQIDIIKKLYEYEIGYKNGVYSMYERNNTITENNKSIADLSEKIKEVSDMGAEIGIRRKDLWAIFEAKYLK